MAKQTKKQSPLGVDILRIDEKQRNNATVIAAMIAFVTLALLLLARSSAGNVALESENGNLSNATQQADSSASGGFFVQFANAQGGGSIQRFPGDPNPLVTGKSYFGASVGGNSEVVNRHEVPSGKSLSIRRTFFQWNDHDNPPNDSLYNYVRDDHSNNRLPWVSTKTPPWSEFQSGQHDARIDRLLTELDSYDKPTWLTFHHEPEGGAGQQCIDNNWDAQDWKDMQIRVRQRMDALNTQNIAFAPIIMPWTQDPNAPACRGGLDNWWVDGIWDFYGADPYSEREDGNPFNSTWGHWDQWIESKNIPYAYGEWGIRGDGQSSGDYMREFWEHGFNEGKDIVGMAYFDSGLNSPNGSWALTGSRLTSFHDILGNDSRVMRINELNQQSGSNYGTVIGSITVPNPGDYRVWVRMKANGSANNTVGVNVAGNNFIAGGNGVSSSGWTWVDWEGSSTNKMDTNLSAGSSTITLTGTDPGVQVDRVLITDETCTPTSFGDNCIDTTPPPVNDVSITAPQDGSTVSGNVTISVSSSSTINEVAFRPDNVWAATINSAPYEWTWDTTNVANGEHTIVTRTRFAGDPGGVYTENSITVTVDNSTPPPTTTPGDTDNDGDADIADLSKLLSDWDPQGNNPGSTADFNNDGKVDVVDLSVLLSNYGT